jgi:hypothetical protein
MHLNDGINKGNKEENIKVPFEISQFNFSPTLLSLRSAGVQLRLLWNCVLQVHMFELPKKKIRILYCMSMLAYMSRFGLNLH